MWGNSQINVMRGNSSLNMVCGANKATCKGFNVVRIQNGNTQAKIEINDTTTLLWTPKIESIDWYSKNYPCKIEEDEIILYKSVRKAGDKYLANYDKTTEYKIGEYLECDIDPQTDNSCSKGLHASHLSWALNFSSGWSDRAILELRIKIKDCIVAKDCDGKLRTSKLFVVREVPESEFETLKETR